MNKLFIVLLLALGFSVCAEGNKKGKAGDDFRAAAVKYETKAKICLEKGYAECSKIYFRMAAIKKNAAKLADEGKWDDISWDEYSTLEKKLNTLKANHSGKNKKHKK